MRKGLLASCVFLLSFMCLEGFSQAQLDELGWHERNRLESAIESFVQSHKRKIGIFRFQPRLTISGGFDSNAVFGNVEDEREGDFFFSVRPGISGGLKFGSRAYFRVIQEVDFLYYFENEHRRDIFGTTSGEFVTGRPNLLLTLDGSYSRREQQVNEEVDEPVEFKQTLGGARVEYSLGNKTEIRHALRLNHTSFVEDDEFVNDILNLQDRRTTSFSTGLGFSLRRTARLTGDLHISRSETQITGETSNAWEILGGIETQRDRVRGRAKAGFGQADSGDDRTQNNFLLDGRIDLLFGRRLTVGGFARRRYEFSFLSETAVLVNTQGGVRFFTPIMTRVSLNGDYTIGQHDYGDTVIAGVPVEKDIFHRADLGLPIQLARGVFVRPGIRYFKRDTDIPGLSKSYFYYYVGFGFGYSFEL